MLHLYKQDKDSRLKYLKAHLFNDFYHYHHSYSIQTFITSYDSDSLSFINYSPYLYIMLYNVNVNVNGFIVPKSI